MTAQERSASRQESDRHPRTSRGNGPDAIKSSDKADAAVHRVHPQERGPRAATSEAPSEASATEAVNSVLETALRLERQGLENGWQGWASLMRSNLGAASQLSCVAADAFAATLREVSELQCRSVEAGTEWMHALAEARNSEDVLRAHRLRTRRYMENLTGCAERLQAVAPKAVRETLETVTTRACTIGFANAAPVI